ncbi:hypothetical protein BpHYR1_027065 [Brachionus plicatilis]|uniref:Uncharacterized protein n=1 Tax=Brachionus plicatilis TaxID=10195 RepID=A0A3M7SEW3_BRAPC|nr:hypothetical protein BpHYR1_027065 [Brachionus plicatilis]
MSLENKCYCTSQNILIHTTLHCSQPLIFKSRQHFNAMSKISIVKSNEKIHHLIPYTGYLTGPKWTHKRLSYVTKKICEDKSCLELCKCSAFAKTGKLSSIMKFKAFIII